MSARDRIMNVLLDSENPQSVAARSRKRRWERFTEAFPEFSEMRVLDVGGRPDFWRTMETPPAAVTVLNLERASAPESWIDVVVGDACDPPDRLRAESFDLVFSNSLIEHVGGIANRQRCADFIRSKADQYWVQTPYRYFPVEPHWLFPGFQFLPLAARAAVTRRWPLGYMRQQSALDALQTAQWVELVTITEMRASYPDAAIWYERFAGLVKSVTAVKTSRRPV